MCLPHLLRQQQALEVVAKLPEQEQPPLRPSAGCPAQASPAGRWQAVTERLFIKWQSSKTMRASSSSAAAGSGGGGEASRAGAGSFAPVSRLPSAGVTSRSLACVSPSPAWLSCTRQRPLSHESCRGFQVLQHSMHLPAASRAACSAVLVQQICAASLLASVC